MLSRRLRAPTEREVSIGDGLMAAYQKKLDEEVLKAIDKVNFDNVRCDIDISASNCVRLTSSGEQSFLDWFVVPGNAIDAFVREFLAFMVKLRMLEGIRMKELIWRMTPKLINSVDGWAVVSWVRSRSTQGYYMSGEVVICKKCKTEMNKIERVPRQPDLFSGYTEQSSTAATVTTDYFDTPTPSRAPDHSQGPDHFQNEAIHFPIMNIAEYECPNCGWRDQIEE